MLSSSTLLRPTIRLLTAGLKRQHQKKLKTFAHKMTQPTRPIERFKRALQSVYGPFDTLTADTIASWAPPSDPGAGGHRGRYLWTDAFGVVGLITLFRETSSPLYLQLARRLVAAVHDVLGRERGGALARLPGATDAEPLAGGLRIGKLDARGADGDGQYHHYLTLWMFALNKLALAADDAAYNDLAVQLARAIHPRFVVRGTSGLRMVWKISTDMQHVLVPSEGHLDAATGFVIYRLLQRTSSALSPRGNPRGNNPSARPPLLQHEIDDYRTIMQREGKLRASSDPLDMGMGLWTAHFFRGEEWAAQLGRQGLAQARGAFGGMLRREASSHRERLAFREFGACLGVECYGGDGELQGMVDELVAFWERHAEQQEEELRPISQVMYAAALIPGGELANACLLGWS